MALPDKRFRWAENDVVDGTSLLNNVVEPPEIKKTNGWNRLEKPARNWWNWCFRYIQKWIDYIYDTALNDVFTFVGIKTFSSIPILPGSDPTTDNQATRKLYVDSLSKISLVTSDSLLSNIQRYKSVNNINLTLPSSANEGDILEIFSEDISTIVQGDAENIIVSDKFQTTKGISGFLKLFKKNYLKMIYKGIGNYISMPGTKLSDPLTLPNDSGRQCCFSDDGVYFAVTTQSTPYLIIYKISGDTFTALTNPVTLPAGVAYGCCFSPDGIYLAIAHASSPYITIYKRTGDTFTKLSDPGILPASDGRGCCFSPDGTYLVVGHQNSPYITIYKRSGDTFTKLTNPVNLPTGEGHTPVFSYDMNYLAIAHASSPYITIYKRSADTFTKLSNPGTLPANDSYGASFSYDGIYLAVTNLTTSPYITIYKRSGDTFTKLPDPAVLPPGSPEFCSFSYDGNYLSISHDVSPYVTIYKRTGDTFTKIANPSILPNGTSHGCKFSRFGMYLAVNSLSTPFVTIYKNMLSANKMWIIEDLKTSYPDDMQYLFN